MLRVTDLTNDDSEGPPFCAYPRAQLVEGSMRNHPVRTCGLLVLSIVLTACKGTSTTTPATSTADAKLKRGEYLVSVLGCDDCHSPKVMGKAGPEIDKSRRLSGHSRGALPPPAAPGNSPWGVTTTLELTAWSGPWGTSYAMNLTPDQNTGLGIWTEEMFVKMVRTGKHMGQSRPVLPPMPIAIYSNLTDDDLKAVFAYLHSLPAIENAVPDPVIAPPPG
jgi:cytochrome c553